MIHRQPIIRQADRKVWQPNHYILSDTQYITPLNIRYVEAVHTAFVAIFNAMRRSAKP